MSKDCPWSQLVGMSEVRGFRSFHLNYACARYATVFLCLNAMCAMLFGLLQTIDVSYFSVSYSRALKSVP